MTFFRNAIPALRAGLLLTWLLLLVLEARVPRSVSSIVSPHIFFALALALFIPVTEKLTLPARRLFLLITLLAIALMIASVPGVEALSRVALGLILAAVAIYVTNEYL